MDILSLIDAVQGIARNGLNYAKNPHDIERYQRLLEIASQTYSDTLDLPSDEVQKHFSSELGQITPKVGAVATIFDAQGQILLMQRSDDHTWGLISGWIEPHETPEETVVREAKEETGLHVEIVNLVDVITRRPSAAHGPHMVVSVIYYCKAISGELQLSHEGLDLRYWPIEDVDNWHMDHKKMALAAYSNWQKTK